MYLVVLARPGKYLCNTRLKQGHFLRDPLQCITDRDIDGTNGGKYFED
jgi:hypothetical protein